MILKRLRRLLQNRKAIQLLDRQRTLPRSLGWRERGVRPGCERIPPATLQVPNREEHSLAEKEGANGGGVVKREKGGDGARRKKGKSNEEVP